MSWILDRLLGYAAVLVDGVPVARRRILNFVGATVTDNPAKGQTDVVFSGGLDLGSDPPEVIRKAAGEAGVSPDASRSDHRHGILTDEPESLACGATSNAEGTSEALARADHLHAVPAGAPVAVGAALSEGSSQSFARADHVHSLGGWITIGGSPATSGVMRVDNDVALVVARNATNTGNLTCVASDSTNNVLIGQQASETGDLFLRTSTFGRVRFVVGAVESASLEAGGFLDLPANGRISFDYKVALACDGTTLAVGPGVDQVELGRNIPTVRVASLQAHFFGNWSGDGEGVLYVENAAVVPTDDPSTGGVLYAEAGALKWRGPTGTVTTIAPA